MKKRLIEIVTEGVELLEYKQALEEHAQHCAEEGIDNDVPDEINERLYINENEMDEKLTATWAYMNDIDGEIYSLDNMIKKLQAKKKTRQREKSNLMNYVGFCLQLYGKQNDSGNHFYKNSLFKVTAANSKKVEVFDENAVPNEFKTEEVTVKVDKAEIRKLLLDGKEVEGCVLDTTKINVNFR
tara:strand:+ start:294 stop:845 length:552 start_codon:yes stop_codon:yes gene_type:complete